MDRYDRLPEGLRVWLAQAALPWSAASALRLWTRCLWDCGGDPAAARHCLDRVEAGMLRRDAAKIWGAEYPLHARIGHGQADPQGHEALPQPVSSRR